MRPDKAKEKIPGVGVVSKAGLAERFIAAMRAKHRIGKPASDDRTVTVQLTREETEWWLPVLSAALSAVGR
ncbi:MAG: hypothetical protein EOP86_19600 [Verrucomicrobiaceae bacterium]|nr:MAG: hypothetical protein EOP86_19600 [Verrucomicrobiaceae bacterium]